MLFNLDFISILPIRLGTGDIRHSDIAIYEVISVLYMIDQYRGGGYVFLK